MGSPLALRSETSGQRDAVAAIIWTSAKACYPGGTPGLHYDPAWAGCVYIFGSQVGNFEIPPGAKEVIVYGWMPMGAAHPTIAAYDPQSPQARVNATRGGENLAPFCLDASPYPQPPACIRADLVPFQAMSFLPHGQYASLVVKPATRAPTDAVIQNVTLYYGDSSSTSALAGSIGPSSSSRPRGGSSQRHSSQPSKGMLVGITVPVAILSVLFVTWLFLLSRRKRRRLSASDLNVAHLPGSGAPEHFGDRGSGTRNDKMLLLDMGASLSKRANVPPDPQLPMAIDDPPTSSPNFMLGAPSTASPRQMAELTVALYRAGLSVNELMSSLDRVSRFPVEVDANGYSHERNTGVEANVTPPRYEA